MVGKRNSDSTSFSDYSCRARDAAPLYEPTRLRGFCLLQVIISLVHDSEKKSMQRGIHMRGEGWHRHFTWYVVGQAERCRDKRGYKFRNMHDPYSFTAKGSRHCTELS
jgi:hypothetical protein